MSENAHPLETGFKPAAATPPITAPVLAAELLIADDPARAADLLETTWAMVYRYAPTAPAAVQREAIIRTAGYLLDQPPASFTMMTVGPMTNQINPARQSALRHAGRRRCFRRGGCAGPARSADMRWPWQKFELREASGGYTEIISRLIEAQAAGTTQQASATAAMEAAAGLLSRAFAGATVEGPDDIAAALTPRCLALIGRGLVRVGESLHVIRMMGGRLRLVPASTWYWEGDADPESWICTATAYGPSGSTTWRVPRDSVVFCEWGSPTARPYHGLGPATWAAETARLNANAERTLADEAGGPVAGLLPIPEGHEAGGDGDDDPLAALRSDIGKASGRALLIETVSGGYGEGKSNAPHRDWDPRYLHPSPTESMVKLSEAAFGRMLAAAGCAPALFDRSAPATALKEGLRQFHLGTVRPLARILEHELSTRFEAGIRLRFDNYPLDLAGRAMAFQKLVAGGVAVNEALVTAGLLEDE